MFLIFATNSQTSSTQLSAEAPHNDKELFTLITQGSEKAFADLYIAYARILSPFLYKLTRNQEASEDIFQNTFLAVWMNRDKMADIENPRAWIFRIAANNASTWLTKNNLTQRTEQQAVEGSGQGKDFTTQQVLYNDAKRLVEQAISELAPQRRKIYNIYREQGLKYGEIAEQLNISASTVRTAISLSLEHIRERLAQAGLFTIIIFFNLR